MTAIALGHSGDPRALAVFRADASSEDWDVAKANAIWGLVASDDVDVKELTTLYRDLDPERRWSLVATIILQNERRFLSIVKNYVAQEGPDESRRKRATGFVTAAEGGP